MYWISSVLVFFTCQTVYWKFSRAVTCIGKLTKLSNVLCKNTKMGDRRKKKKKKKKISSFLNVLLRIALKTRSVNKRKFLDFFVRNILYICIVRTC